MPLRLSDQWTDRSSIPEWRLPGEPRFAPSRAFSVLSRELRRYVREEVAGRSFLIAGHRGAGKTALVSQAVLKLRNDILMESTDPARAPFGRRGRLQRPLIVKLVGQSLLAPAPKAAGGAKADPKATAQQPAPAVALTIQAGAPASAGPADAAASATREAATATDADDAADGGEATKDEKTNDRVGNALVHITIALYRALAAEIAEGYGFHAIASGALTEASDERLELAAQLALDLDGAPEPASLRGYWSRIGRLRDGILWPAASRESLRAGLIADQGLRELIALTTAAQAFRICIGDISEKEIRKNIDERKSTTTMGADVKEMFNRFGALGAGALAGGAVGAGSGAGAGVATGLLVWLLSGITLSWSGSRKRDSDRTLDYTFMRDRSVQTLDRDLPLVIDRIRHAGLAPVFVIDELDKLEDPDGQIAHIIDRLKHFVADYGFFCFLTGRDYFDRIERKVAEAAYPNEHTYFSARLLVLNRPADLFDYLHGLIEEAPDDATHQLRAAVFALFVMYRSRLNFTDAAREIARWCDEDDVVRIADNALQTAGRFRLSAAIQIAIDFILSTEAVADRLDTDPLFAQMAIDALYMLPRLLEKDSDATVDVSEAAVERALRGRMRGRREEEGGNAADAASEHAPLISRPYLRELSALVARQISYLSDFELLKQALQDTAASEPDPEKAAALRLRADIVPGEMKRLVEPVTPGKAGELRFVLNELGQPLPPPHSGHDRPTAAGGAIPASASGKNRATAAPSGRPRNEQSAGPEGGPGASDTVLEFVPSPESSLDEAQITVLLAYPLLGEFQSLLREQGLRVEDIVAAELLPRTLSSHMVVEIEADVAALKRDRSRHDAAERALNGLATLKDALDRHGADVAHAMFLLRYASHMADGPLPAGPALLRMARYFGPSTGGMVPYRTGANWVGMSGDPQSLHEFRTRMQRPLKDTDLPPDWPTVNVSRVDLDLEWRRWQMELHRLLPAPHRRGAMPASVALMDILLAASDRPPGNLFRADLQKMTQVDWSRAALAALPGRRGHPAAPRWLLIVALSALGFNFRLLSSLLEKPTSGTQTSADNRAFLWEVVQSAGPADAATLAIYRGTPGRANLEIQPGEPVLSIERSEYDDYVEGLNWLAGLGAFREVTYE